MKQLTEEEQFHKDWKEAESIIVILNRPNGTIAKHLFSLDEMQAVQLVLNAFQCDIMSLFQQKCSSTTVWDGKIYGKNKSENTPPN